MTDRLTWTRDDFRYLLLTLALTVFAIAPLAYPGYAQVHSGFIPAYNLADLASTAPDLSWTPGVATHFDPLRGDGILAYYLGLPVVWLGGTPLNGVKIVFALGTLLGAVGAYVWLRKRLGPGGAALAALVYTYLPYHLAVVYVRGAWGEALFLGLVPWGMAAAASMNRPGKSAETSQAWTRMGWLALTTLIWAGLGLAQAGLTIWAFILLVAWALWIDRVSHPYASLLAALGGTLVGLALTFMIAGFSLPPLPIDFFDHFLFPAQLFSAHWGFGASRPGWNDGLALGLGFAAVGLAMLTLILAATRAQADNLSSSSARAAVAVPSDPTLDGPRPPNPVKLFILGLALTVLLFGPLAALWRLTGLSHTLSYPWQLLGLIGLMLAVLAGTSVRLDRRLATLPAYAGLVILTLLSSYSYLEPRFTQHMPGTGPLAAWGAQRLILLDYDLSLEIPPAAAGLLVSTSGRLPLADSGPPQPGDTLHVTLTWQATRPFYRDLKLFAHLLDGSGQVIAQTDPLAGLGAGPDGEDYFTSQWDPGELILNDVAIMIPADAPPGPYRLAFGLYDGETLERLPVAGQEDARVVLELGE